MDMSLLHGAIILGSMGLAGYEYREKHKVEFHLNSITGIMMGQLLEKVQEVVCIGESVRRSNPTAEAAISEVIEIVRNLHDLIYMVQYYADPSPEGYLRATAYFLNRPKEIVSKHKPQLQLVYGRIEKKWGKDWQTARKFMKTLLEI
jgi:hypothetical protein